MLFALLAALVLHIPAYSDSATSDFRLKAEATEQAEGTKRLREESFQSDALGRQMKYRVLHIDCGTSDALIVSNRQVIEALSKSGAAYEYQEVVGSHSWDYWDRRVREFLTVLMKKMANQ